MKLNLFKDNFHNVKYQLIGTLCANTISLGYGFHNGWVGPFLPLLQSDESPLQSGPVNVVESSWLGSIMMLGNILCNLTLGSFSAYCGRRNALMILGIPSTLFWIIVYFATDIKHLYIARFLAGMTGGGMFSIMPLYIAEIAGKDVRGTLSSVMFVTTSTGTLISYIVAAFLSYYTHALIFMSAGVISLVVLAFIPETPLSLLRRHKIEEAERSLRYYNNFVNDLPLEKCGQLKDEFENLKLIAHSNDDTSERITLKDLCNRESCRALAIGCFVMILSQFSGCSVLMTYTTTIFQYTRSTLDPYMSSVVLAFTQLIGIFLSMVLVDRAGRKILILISSIGVGIGFAISGTYTYLNKTGVDVSSFNWVPLVSLCGVILLGGIGILPLCFIILTEVLPNKIRSFGSVFCLLVRGSCTFTMVKTFPLLNEVIDLDGCMWLYSGVCVIGALIIIFFIPETKGKNLNIYDEQSS